MWVTKAEIGDRELREIFLDFGRVYLGRGKPQGRREDGETVPYMAQSPAHAPAGGLWAGLMRLAALIAGHTSASFHYFHGLYSSDMNSFIYIIMNTRFEIDLTLL